MKLTPTRLLAGLAVAAAALPLQATAADDQRHSKVTKGAQKALAEVRADADMQQVLDTFAAFNGKAIEKITVPEARAQPTVTDAVNVLLKKQGRPTDPEQLVPGVKAADRKVAGSAGPLDATVYTPAGAGPFPVITYFHGGGWVIADRKVYDGGARGLAKAANAVVVSVDYRRAPEAKFPAQWDDALAAYQWVAANAAELNGDPQRLALAGESAGGNLAVATAIAAKGSPTAPKAVLAVYPVAQTSLNTPSYLANAIAAPLNRAMIPWFLDKLLRSEADKQDPRLDLVHADLQGLPPVTIVNADIDPLQSDGAELESALKKAGVPVERRNFNGVTHEFFGMAAVVAKAKEAQAYAGQRLTAAFGATRP